MNQIVSYASFGVQHPVEPQAHRFTAAEVNLLAEHGFFGERRVELINGEVFEMPGEGELHQGLRELIQNDLVLWLGQHRPRMYVVGTNGPIRLDDENEPEPDIYVRPRSMPLSEVHGADSLLVIEIASTSHAHDFGRKQPMYARFGAAELWIIDAVKEVTVVHRGPGADGSWREMVRTPVDTPVSPNAFSGYVFRLSDHLAELRGAAG